MRISELSERSGVPPKTIRYYESIDLLPAPQRRANQYRQYNQEDVDRARFVAGARRLDFSLAEIGEILDLRDRRIAPCPELLMALNNKQREIQQRIEELKILETQLVQLHKLGLSFPADDRVSKRCLCHSSGN